MLRRPTTYVAALALAALLAACGAPPPAADPGPFQVAGVYVDDPLALPMAVVVLAVDLDVAPVGVAADAPVATSASEFAPGYYVVASGVIGQNGDLELTFVDADEVPDAVLAPAAEAFVGAFGASLPAGCTVVADDPTARAVAFGLGGPGTLPITIGFTPDGIAPLLFATSTLGPAPTTATLILYAFADRPVALTSTGTCVDGDQDLSVDVELAAGWNRVALRLVGLGAPPVDVVVEDDAGSALRVQFGF
jgi:hypothetical protein